MSQDWANHDFYGALEVATDVDTAALKRAYRRMAQLHHPDANPGDTGAPERFRMVALAYGVLSDPAQREIYDRIRSGDPVEAARRAVQEAEPEAEPTSTAGSILGKHIITTATLPLEAAARGTTVKVSLESGEELAVDLPPGVDDGDIIRVEGQGHSLADGETAGDLIVIVHVPPHPRFERNGMDLTTRVPVTLSTAAMGGDVVVPVLGGHVTITIPAATSIGSRFQLEGLGIAKPGAPAGDLFVILEAAQSDTMRHDATRGSFAGLVETLEGDMEVIPTVGQPFDPELHEAVRVAAPGDGTLMVTGEVRRGYRVKGQVIRPALVTVAYQQKTLREGTQP
jgi:molecular chaperone DnaJ